MDKKINLILQEMINYFGKDVKRINHAIKVYSFAYSIALLEGLSEDEIFIVRVAAILHDIGIKVSEEKYNSSMGKYQEIEGPSVALDLLEKYNIKKTLLDRICFIIGNHHSYNKIDGVDFQILVEADFLVNIYEENLECTKIKAVKEKCFKTNAGTEYINRMYLI